MDEFRITQMTHETVPVVAKLECACFSTPWSERSIREELGNEWAFWLTAMEGERLLGYIGIQYGLDGGDIMTIATEPDYWGKGIGKKLVLAAVEILKEKNLGYLTLEVRPSNLPAIALYESLGFREVGRRKKYYRDPTEDALLMTKFFEEETLC